MATRFSNNLICSTLKCHSVICLPCALVEKILDILPELTSLKLDLVCIFYFGYIRICFLPISPLYALSSTGLCVIHVSVLPFLCILFFCLLSLFFREWVGRDENFKQKPNNGKCSMLYLYIIFMNINVILNICVYKH